MSHNMVIKLQEREQESKYILKQMEKKLAEEPETGSNDISFDAPEISIILEPSGNSSSNYSNQNTFQTNSGVQF